MELGILGSVTIGDETVAEYLHAPKPRRVLALLMVNPGRVVGRTEFFEELWGYSLPASSLATLQDYVSQVRKVLAVLAPEVSDVRRDALVTSGAGYALLGPEQDSDVHRFRQLAERGRQALMVGNDELARRLLGDALAVWRGEPLADTVPGPVLGMYVDSLTQERIRVIEQRVEADLRLGRQYEVVGELSALLRKSPTNESMYRQFMIALYRCGRRAEALEAYRSLRAHLVRELDVEPSRELQRLHQAILVSSSELDLDHRRPRRESIDLELLAGRRHRPDGATGPGRLPVPNPRAGASADVRSRAEDILSTRP